MRKLYQELQVLTKGENIDVKLPQYSFPMRLCWVDGDIGDYSFDDQEAMSWFDEQIERAGELSLKSFNVKIKRFLNKCDQAASDFNLDRGKFLQQIEDYGNEKYPTKSATAYLKQQIKDTENRLKELKSQLSKS
jgi:flavodoxin